MGIDDKFKQAIENLVDENKNIRQQAVRTLGKIGGPRAVDPLIQAMNDNDKGVRYWAILALGKIGDKRAVDPLIHAMNNKDRIRRPHAHQPRLGAGRYLPDLLPRQGEGQTGLG